LLAIWPSKRNALLVPGKRDVHFHQRLEIKQGRLASSKYVPLELGREEREPDDLAIMADDRRGDDQRHAALAGDHAVRLAQR